MKDETVCPKCGGNVRIEEENVGFTAPDPEYWVFETVCENGCDLSDIED